MTTPHDSLADIGFWYVEAVADPRKKASVNATPVDVTKDQMIQLYMLLYPFLASEFVHRSDVESWAKRVLEEFNEKISALNDKLEALTKAHMSHMHTTGQPGLATEPASDTGLAGDSLKYSIEAPKLEAWESKPSQFAFGESLIADKSGFTLFMPHRHPDQDPTGYSPRVSIAKSYQDAHKMTPFDANGGDLYTGDLEYVNTNSQ